MTLRSFGELPPLRCGLCSTAGRRNPGGRKLGRGLFAAPVGRRELLESVLELLPHAVDIAQGRTQHWLRAQLFSGGKSQQDSSVTATGVAEGAGVD